MKVALSLLVSLLFCIHLIAQDDDSLHLAELLQKLETSKEDTSKVNLMLKLADKHAGYENDLSMKYAKNALTLSQKTNFTKGIANAYYSVAKCFYYKYEFDSAKYYYNSSKEIIKLEVNIDVAAKFESLIGLVYQIQSDYTKAINSYNRSLESSRKLGDKQGMAYCYNDIGAAFYNLGDYQKALDNYFKSLKLNEEIDNQSMVARTMANIGGIYEEQEKYERALEYYNKAIIIATELGSDKIIADTYRNIGGIYYQNHNFDSALVVYEKALDIYKKTDDIRGIIGLYNFFGQTYVSMIERQSDKSKIEEYLDKALQFYNHSLDLNNRELNETEQKIISYQGIGEVYFYRSNYYKSIEYLEVALYMAEEIESIDNMKSAYEFLGKAYSKIGNYKKAFEAHVNYKNYNDTLKSDQNVELLTQMSMQYEFDKEQELKELEYEQQKKQDRLIRIFILSVLVIVLGFSVQVFRSYQRKKKDNVLLAEQNEEIERQKEEITDSIKYAKRIQTAILPSDAWANENLPEHFILFRPRDIVSGDYYWMNKIGNKVILVAADCTGHGVPGAFMSMLGVSFLNEIVNKNHTLEPHDILNQLRNQVKRTLDQTGKEGEAKDGMDIALCVIDFDTMKLQYAGAYNPLWLYRNGELMETKADKMPIGIYIREKESFTNHEIQLEKGDTFYIFSDGYADQFGGPNGSKFKSKTFKRLLAEIQPKSMEEQWEILESTIDDWRGDIEQIDDMIVLGVRV